MIQKKKTMNKRKPLTSALWVGVPSVAGSSVPNFQT